VWMLAFGYLFIRGGGPLSLDGLIKTQREYEALDKEIRDATEKEQGLRKELLKEQQAEEELRLALEKDQVMIQKQEEDVAEEQSKIKLKVKEKNVELKKLAGDERRITPGLDEDILFKFERIIRNKAGIGICLDTSHVFAAGYDIRTQKAYLKVMAGFNAVIGRRHLYVVHLNDSKKGLGSKVDRHEHIGRGEIGMPAFNFVMNDAALAGIPKIIETPKAEQGKDWDAVNLKCLRGLVKG